jgi:hypothetical protein
MGALLVVLVAVTRSARDVAIRRMEAEPAAPVVDTNPESLAELKKIQEHVARLEQVRQEAAHTLREDQQRLSHLEDHMRRLQDELRELQTAAIEIKALEDDHYDDREQAQREVERLQQLIADTRTVIEELKREQHAKKRSYALIPYEGPNGTARRPIYLECRDGELILQPEGVRISRDDLRPPIGAGNPLGSALRAARDHLVRLHPQEGRNRDTEPYPLVVVRPSGANMFSLAQRAIESADFDFGYELAEEDWELKYPAPDPQLALVEQQAVDQARVRQLALAAAAPRAYRHPALAMAGRFESNGDGSGNGGFDESGAGESDRGDGLPGSGLSSESDAGTGGYGGAGGGGQGNDNSSAGVDADGSQREEPGRSGTAASGTSGDQGTAGSNEAAAAAGTPAGPGTSVSGSSSSAASSSGQPAGAQNGLRPDSRSHQSNIDLSMTRGQDWALRPKTPHAVPIRRGIHVVVRGDHLAILSDEIQPNGRVPIRKTVPLARDTAQSVDEFVKAVQDQIEGWGMAGDGMYWRPTLELQVGPDGHGRADDLRRLLKNSGLDVRAAATANQPPRGNERATR